MEPSVRPVRTASASGCCNVQEATRIGQPANATEAHGAAAENEILHTALAEAGYTGDVHGARNAFLTSKVTCVALFCLCHGHAPTLPLVTLMCTQVAAGNSP